MWVGEWGWTRNVTTPQCNPAWGRGAPVSQNFPRMPPWGGWLVRAAAQILPGIPLSAQIHVDWEESGGSPSVWVSDWSLGGAPYLATKKFPAPPPPNFQLVKNLGSAASRSDPPSPPCALGIVWGG